MKTIRSGMFETNSSSAHTLTFKGDLIRPDLPINQINNKVSIPLGYFGKSYEEYFDSFTKLQYILTCIWCFCGEDLEKAQNNWYFKEIEDIIKSYIPECSGLEIYEKAKCGFDHQSYPEEYGDFVIFGDGWNMQTIKQFIFNPNVGLMTGWD